VAVETRLADLLAGLSRLADLGFGLQAGEALRSCALATRLARSLDLPEEDARAAFYTALLHHVGCTGYAHETARVFGDELVLNLAAGRANPADPRDLFATFLPTLLRGRPPLERARLAAATLARGNRFGTAYTTAACEVGRDAARRLGLPETVQRGVYHVYEEWRGGGDPAGLAGDEIPAGSRLARLTGIAVLFDTAGGVELAADAVRRRGGGMLDPELAARFAGQAEVLLGEVNTSDPRAMVLEGEPRPVVTVPDRELAGVAATFADLADLKSPATHGHSREVAGLLHDVGRVAVSDVVWEKPAPLSAHEREQVRLHAYHSERILAGSERLAALAPLAGMHHERLDGRGYHRGCSGPDLSLPARVLAAADAFQAMTQPRPHRPALAPEEAERRLLAAARDGSLDPDAVAAVLAAAGHDAVVARREPPAGLSAREVEVLGLVAEGCSNAQIAQRLVISRRTAEHHVQHIYTKIGVSSRAAAALFAMEHHLLPRRDG
jgi:HD-GYP domain-containing protein (c-di-GMP phosphodiesterase class II)